MRSQPTLFALGIFVAALCTLYGLWTISSMIQTERDARAAREVTSGQEAVRAASQARLRALEKDTVLAREELAGHSRVTVLTVLSDIESVGAISGATITVHDAAKETSPTGAAPSVLHAINFSIEIRGSFSSVMRALSLLETLAIPATVQQVDLAADQTPGASLWKAQLQLRVLTSIDLSS